MTLPPLPHPTAIRLVVTDMDGTLLTPQGDVPDGLWPVLERLHAAGIVLVPASGRQHASIAASFPPASTPGHDALVVIAENGLYVTRGGTEVSSVTTAPDAAAAVVRAVREIPHDVGIVVAGKRSAYVERTDDAFVEHVHEYYPRLTVVDDASVVDDEVLKLAIYSSGDSATTIAPWMEPFRQTQQVVVSSPHWVDVMPLGGNKGVALRSLQAELDVTPGQTIVFGDYLNDVEMMAAATWSYAMAGAHPAVLAHARHVAPGNDEHGVVRVLEAMLDQAR